jgi:transcriptional regulator with XRE-family HTH domain
MLPLVTPQQNNPRSPENADHLARLIREKREATLMPGPSNRRDPMTQAQLADRLGVSQVSVSRWETGRSRPETDMLPALIKALKLDGDKVWAAYRETFTPRLPNRSITERLDLIEREIARLVKTAGLAPLPESLPASRRRR